MRPVPTTKKIKPVKNPVVNLSFKIKELKISVAIALTAPIAGATSEASARLSAL